MAKVKTAKKPVKKSAAKRARVTKSRNKNLEALLKSQQITDILKAGNVEGQAILDSAGEQRPSDESHVVDLLEKRKPRIKDVIDIVEKKDKKARR